MRRGAPWGAGRFASQRRPAVCTCVRSGSPLREQESAATCASLSPSLQFSLSYPSIVQHGFVPSFTLQTAGNAPFFNHRPQIRGGIAVGLHLLEPPQVCAAVASRKLPSRPSPRYSVADELYCPTIQVRFTVVSLVPVRFAAKLPRWSPRKSASPRSAALTCASSMRTCELLLASSFDSHHSFGRGRKDERAITSFVAALDVPAAPSSRAFSRDSLEPSHAK